MSRVLSGIFGTGGVLVRSGLQLTNENPLVFLLVILKI